MAFITCKMLDIKMLIIERWSSHLVWGGGGTLNYEKMPRIKPIVNININLLVNWRTSRPSSWREDFLMLSWSELSDDLSNRLGLLLNKSNFLRLLNPLLSFLWLNWWFLERFQVPRLLFSKKSKRRNDDTVDGVASFSNLSPFTENCVGGFECLSFLCPATGLSDGFLSSSSPPLLWLLWLLPSPPHSSRFLNNYS